MVSRITLLSVLLIISTSSIAGGGGAWFSDWWGNVYEQRIEKQQYEQLKQEQEDKCSTKLFWYEQKTQEEPKSEYYQYKLEKWQKRCR